MAGFLHADAPARLCASYLQDGGDRLLNGFKDNIVMCITPQAGGSVVDLRSLSRAGLSDIGTNATRVRAVPHALAGS